MLFGTQPGSNNDVPTKIVKVYLPSYPNGTPRFGFWLETGLQFFARFKWKAETRFVYKHLRTEKKDEINQTKVKYRYFSDTLGVQLNVVFPSLGPVAFELGLGLGAQQSTHQLTVNGRRIFIKKPKDGVRYHNCRSDPTFMVPKKNFVSFFSLVS